MPWLLSVVVSTAPGRAASEAGPAGAAFEFGAGIEQLGAATGAFKFARGRFSWSRGLVPEPFSSVLAQNAVLFRGQSAFWSPYKEVASSPLPFQYWVWTPGLRKVPSLE